MKNKTIPDLYSIFLCEVKCFLEANDFFDELIACDILYKRLNLFFTEKNLAVWDDQVRCILPEIIDDFNPQNNLSLSISDIASLKSLYDKIGIEISSSINDYVFNIISLLYGAVQIEDWKEIYQSTKSVLLSLKKKNERANCNCKPLGPYCSPDIENIWGK